MFSWNNVHGSVNERLLRFLRDDLDIGWADDAEILKLDDGKAIRIVKDENKVEITIDEKKKATLKISDGRTYDLKVKKENGKLNIYKEPKGKLVYAGGDDVMAFVNLKYMFEVLEKLRIQFPKFEKLGFDIKDNRKSSASAGIVIAHYKTPLSEVLKWARRMEREAKEKGGRDAFAIAVLKHSGEINKTVWKWEPEDGKNLNSRNIKLLEELIKELQDDTNGFSYSFIKNLDMEFRKLGEIKIGNNKILRVELRRLLIRSSQIKGDKERKKEKVEKWQDKLLDCYIDSRTETNFFSFLNIADFLARRTK